MEPLILKDEEEKKFRFRPVSFQFLESGEWEGATQDARWVWPWIRPHRLKLAVAFVLFLVATLSAIALPKLVAKIVDDVLVAKTASFEFWITTLALVMLAKISADLTYKWIVTKTGQHLTKRIRNDVFHQLGAFPLAFFDKNSSGRLISRCVNDVSNLSQFFTANFFTVISDIALITGSLVMMASLSWKASLVVSAILLPLSVYMLNVSQAQMRWSRDLRNILSRLSSHSADTMNNLGVLHSQPFAAKWSRRHLRLQGLYVRTTTWAIFVWGSFSSLHVLVMGLTYAAVIVLGVHLLRLHEITIGSFIASCTYVGLIFGPFFEISEKMNTLLSALDSAKRLRQLLPLPLSLGATDEQQIISEPSGDVVFEQLHFAYRPDRVLFENLNLTLPAGEVTALVGRTGSGKTTLAHLMLGLYPLSSGRIRWGKDDLLALSPGSRARWISHVSQDLFLFTDTLRENLRLWREEISDQQIRERLERVGLWEKIQALPGCLDMKVKAETLPLSQGEKQLLLLCRALLQDPRLLVFDEATANLDQLSEEQWLSHVGELFAGRTTLFIAHRLETLRLATQIVVLENGVIKKILRKPAGAPVREEELH